jgi:two-component system nitrogen regulation response regulator NtrX
MAKILVIDDDDGLRRTLAATLGQQGFQVLQAPSGAKGVQLAREFHPDMILCDVFMEGADGRLTLFSCVATHRSLRFLSS